MNFLVTNVTFEFFPFEVNLNLRNLLKAKLITSMPVGSHGRRLKVACFGTGVILDT